MKNKENLNISGMGSMSGGEFENVSISGMGTISGDLAAVNVQISGNGHIKGIFNADSLTLNGRGAFASDVQIKNCECSGSFECERNVTLETAQIRGRFSVNGAIKGKSINILGYLTSKGGVEAENFDCKGSFAIEGLLNADEIKIFVGGFCSAKEIGCEKITVKQGHGKILFGKLIEVFYSAISGKSIKHNKLVSQCIEGNFISLENTNADIIRGSEVHIGKGCIIGRVEFTESLTVDADSSVNERVNL